MTIEQIASAVLNDTMSGLAGLNNSNIALSLEQLEDEIVALREELVLDW